jgi:hypothetical protein
MNRHEAPQAEVVRGTLEIQVSNVARLTREYARLGVRVLERSRDRARIALPSGVIIVLARRRSRNAHPRIAA